MGVYRIPPGWTREEFKNYLIEQRRNALRERAFLEDKQKKEINRQQKNQTTNQLIQGGATLGGKYLYNQLPSFSEMGLPTLKEMGQGLASTLGFETGKEVAKEAGKQVLTEAGKEVGSQFGQEVGKQALTEVGQEVGKQALTEASKEGLNQGGIQLGQAGLGTALGVAGAIYGGHKLTQAIDSKQGRSASTMAGIGAGASAGAAIGSVVPVVGTAIGAAVGAIVGAITGYATGHLRSGKGQAQQARDDQRKAFLHSMGREKRAGDFTFDFGEGKKFDFGLDGGATYQGVQGNELKAYDLDLANPLANKASQYSQLMAGVGGFGGQLGNEIAQGIVSNSTDENSLRMNAIKILQAQGAGTKADAIAKLQAKGIDPTSARGILDDLYGQGGWEAFSPQTPQPTGGGQQADSNLNLPTGALPTSIEAEEAKKIEPKPTDGNFAPTLSSSQAPMLNPTQGFGTIEKSNPTQSVGFQGFGGLGQSRVPETEEERIMRLRKQQGGLMSVL